MINFKPSDHAKPLPLIQIVPLIDVLFVCLSFFMALSLHFNLESTLNISVPQAKMVSEARDEQGDIVINIFRDGAVMINQKRYSTEDLGTLLKRTVEINPSQAVILRADQKTFHGHVVRVLDECAKAKIWNISFAAAQET